MDVGGAAAGGAATGGAGGAGAAAESTDGDAASSGSVATPDDFDDSGCEHPSVSADCFASIDYFERNGTPFVIAVNCFDGAPRFQPEDMRIALSLGPEVPILLCDARQRESVKQVLVNLVKHVMTVTDPALSDGLR